MITPQQLQALRSPDQTGVRLTDDDIIEQMRNRPEQFGDFLRSYDDVQQTGVKYKDNRGQDVPLSTAKLDELAFGQSPYKAIQPQGYFGNIGERFVRSFGGQETREQRTETKGLENGFLGAVKDIPGDIADVAGPSLPAIGGILGSTAAVPASVTGPGAVAAGFVGATAGATAMEGGRQAIGELIGADRRYGNKPIDPVEGLKEAGVTGLTMGATELVPIGPALKLAGKGMKTSAKLLANVSEDAISWATKYGKVASRKIKEVIGSRAPYLDLATRVQKTLTTALDDASAAIGVAKKDFVEANPNAKFDVSGTWSGVGEAFKKHDINAKIMPGIDGKVEVVPGATGWEPEWGGYLTTFINKFRGPAAKKMTLDDILGLKQDYANWYNKVEYNMVGGMERATQYHRALTTAFKSIEDKISQAMPPQLASAYKQYSSAAQNLEKYGRSFIGHLGKKPIVKDGAEAFLRMTSGMNKGARREMLQEMANDIGIDLPKEIEAISYATELSKWLPNTGSREVDILKALGIKAAATMGPSLALGPAAPVVGAIAGTAGFMATSPRVIGKAATTIGAVANTRAAKGIMGMFNKLSGSEKIAIYGTLSKIIEELQAGQTE